MHPKDSASWLSRLLVLLVAVALLGLLSSTLLPSVIHATSALSLHSAFALGVMPLIMGAISYFVPVLTRSGALLKYELYPALLAFISGALLLFSLRLGYQFFPIAAVLALIAVGWMRLNIQARKKRCLGQPHPCLIWYQSALTLLTLALLAITLGYYWPDQWIALRRFHLHINTLGFIGMTALATLRVLLPTATSIADPDAGQWLHQHWRWYGTGALMIAAGSAWLPYAALAGALLLAYPLATFAKSILTRQRPGIFTWHGAAPALSVAFTGFIVLLLISGLHIHHELAASTFTTLFLLLFLMPLITGAATHLVPLWILPVQQHQDKQAAQAYLGQYAMLRCALFLLSALLVVFAMPLYYLPATLALGQFLYRLARCWITSNAAARNRSQS